MQNQQSIHRCQQQSTTIKNQSSSSFICICSKSYKSYAAIYTHIKNKHKLSRNYLENMQRPQPTHTKKGRPKKIQNKQKNIQIEQMQVAEFGFLQLGKQLDKITKDKIVLDSMEDYDQQKIKKCYLELTKQYGYQIFNILDKQNNNQLKQFFKSFTKHINYKISAKILWTLNYYYAQQMKYLQLDNLSIDINETQKITKIWYNQPQIYKIIINTYKEWLECLFK